MANNYSRQFLDSLENNENYKPQKAIAIAKAVIDNQEIGVVYQKPDGEKFIRLNKTIDNEVRFVRFKKLGGKNV